MRVGINLLYLLPEIGGGTATYAEGLLHGFCEIESPDVALTVYVNREAARWPLPGALESHRVVCPVNAVNRLRRYAFEQWQFPRLLAQHRIEVVHSLGYVAPLRASCPSVVSIHDLNYRSSAQRMPAAKRLLLAMFVHASAHRADRVLTLSEFARSQITRGLGVCDERVVITRPGPGNPGLCVPTAPLAGEQLAAMGIRQPYLLAFSSPSPHKNIPRLVQAFGLLRERRTLPHQLVLVGHLPADLDSTAKATSQAVRCTGFVATPLLCGLLAGAEWLVFPSLYEGFGLPVLEALSQGLPVICSTAASLPEAAGDAAVFFDPRSVKAISEAIESAVGSPGLRAELSRRGRAHASHFSWARTARETLEVYRAVCPPTNHAE